MESALSDSPAQIYTFLESPFKRIQIQKKSPKRTTLNNACNETLYKHMKIVWFVSKTHVCCTHLSL